MFLVNLSFIALIYVSNIELAAAIFFLQHFFSHHGKFSILALLNKWTLPNAI